MGAFDVVSASSVIWTPHRKLTEREQGRVVHWMVAGTLSGALPRHMIKPHSLVLK